MSAPQAIVRQVARVNLLSTSHAVSPAPRRLARVAMTWSTPQNAEVVSSRARGLVMLITPNTHTTTSTTHRTISIGRGTTRRTGGTRVAATIAVKRAIENCRSSGISTPRKRGFNDKYWDAVGDDLSMDDRAAAHQESLLSWSLCRGCALLWMARLLTRSAPAPFLFAATSNESPRVTIAGRRAARV